MSGSDGGASNLVQDFEESFQVGDVVFVHPNNLGQNCEESSWSELLIGRCHN
jgi:hypothetical protein